MFTLVICLIFIIFKAEANDPATDPVEINFQIQIEQFKNGTTLICDHNNNSKELNKYTVLEGEEFKINTVYNFNIYDVITRINTESDIAELTADSQGMSKSLTPPQLPETSDGVGALLELQSVSPKFFDCNDFYDIYDDEYHKERSSVKVITTFTAEKRMGTLWNCMILLHQDIETKHPVVLYKEHNYIVAYCHMEIHVRQLTSPLEILVNNMVLQAVRTDLSEKDVDFTAEYQYADGDVVNVTCINFLDQASLTMEYSMAGTMSDKSTMTELLSYKAIGFVATLHSGHNNSYIICTNTETTEPTDYTKVMVRFVLQKEFSTISVRINGMTLRLKQIFEGLWEGEYKYQSHELITVVCEVQTHMRLEVANIPDGASGYKNEEVIPRRKAKVSFYLNSTIPDPILEFFAYYNSDDSGADAVRINFIEGNFSIDPHPLHMELPSNGTVMELYSDNKLKVIFYEFENGETLQLKCGYLSLPVPGPVLYLQFNDSEKCKTNGCAISKTLHVTHKDENTAIICYLKEQDPIGPSTEDVVLREIRVILRQRVLTTTSSTTTTSPVTTLATVITTTHTATAPASNPVEITFKIYSGLLNESTNHISCDHTENEMQQHQYTVLEGEEFTIIMKMIDKGVTTHINHVICNNYVLINDSYSYMKKPDLSNVITFKAEKRMGTLWNCTILTHRYNSTVLPVVPYKNDIYLEAYCYMKIHVRQKESPLKILVNNMVLQAVRTDLSMKDADFTAEYQYADGDVVDVTCANFLNQAPLTMEYAMAGTISNISTMADLESKYGVIGFFAKLHSGHNNSYIMIYTKTGTDHTNVMVRLVMRTEFNIVNVRFKGKAVRPILKNVVNNHYEIEYKFSKSSLIEVECEVQQTDMHLLVEDRSDFVGKVSSYSKTARASNEALMSFYLESDNDKKLSCLSGNDYINGASVEQVTIRFTASKFTEELYKLEMVLPSKGIVLELYNDKFQVIYYEFHDGEILHLQCGVIFNYGFVSIRYLQLKDSVVECDDYYPCNVNKTFHVTHKDENNEIVCYLKEQEDPFGPREKDVVLRELRVIFREKALTTTSPDTALTTAIRTTNTTADPPPSETNSNTLVYCMSAVGVVAVIIISMVLYLTVQKRCCRIRSTSQELPPIPTPRVNPDTVFYLNLLSVFQPINEREAAELENDYEEID